MAWADLTTTDKAEEVDATKGTDGTHAYCRNPDKTNGGKRKTIWCYTKVDGSEWEYCDPIPIPTDQGLTPEQCAAVMPKGFNQYYPYASRYPTGGAPICKMTAVKFYTDTFKLQTAKSWKVVANDASGTKRYCSDGTTKLEYFAQFDGTHESCQKACIDVPSGADHCRSYDYDLSTAGVKKCCVNAENEYSSSQPTLRNLEDKAGVVHGLRSRYCKQATELTWLAGKWPISSYTFDSAPLAAFSDSNIPIGVLTIQRCDEMCRFMPTCKSLTRAYQDPYGDGSE